MKMVKNRRGLINPVPVYEVMTFLNQRSMNGRVVVNPPTAMAPLEIHKTGESWYFCYICGRSTLDQNKHLKHMKEHSDEEAYVRDDVDQENYEETVDSEDEPLINLIPKEAVKQGPCETCRICNEKFYKQSSLRSHIMIIHADSTATAKCKYCKGHYQKSYLPAHVKNIHNETNAFKCPHCICRMKTLASWSQHISLFHPTKFVKIRNKTPLGISKKSTYRKRRSNTGVFSIENKTPKSTETVSPSYDDNTDGKIIQKDGNVIYRCKICEKSFIKLASLRGHLLIHTGEKPHQCPLCPTKFRLTSTLTGHKKVAHGDGKFACPHCDCRYRGIQAVSKHIKTQHSSKK